MRNKDQILLEAVYTKILEADSFLEFPQDTNKDLSDNFKDYDALKHPLSVLGNPNSKLSGPIWLAVPSHEDYTELYYGSNKNKVKKHIYDKDDYDRFLTSINSRYALVGINDEGIEVAYEADSFDDIVKQMEQDDYNGENFEYTEKEIVEWVKNTEAEGDSGYGFFIFKNGEVVVGNANCDYAKVN